MTPRLLPLLFLFAISIHAAPSKELENLNRLLVGQWKTEMKVKHSNAPEEKFKGEMTCDSAAGGFGILCMLDSEPATKSVREIWLFSYEEDTKITHSFIIEGESSHDHIGKWLDQNTLQIKKIPGEKGCNLIEESFVRKDDNHWGFTAHETNKKGGEDFFEGTFERITQKQYSESAGEEKATDTISKLNDMLLGKWSLEENVDLPDGKKINAHAQVACDHVGAGFGIRCLIDWEKKTGLQQEYWLIGHDKKNETVHIFVIVGNSAHDHVAHLNKKGELVIHRSCITTPCHDENMTLLRVDDKKTMLEGSEQDKKGTVKFRFDFLRQ